MSGPHHDRVRRVAGMERSGRFTFAPGCRFPLHPGHAPRTATNRKARRKRNADRRRYQPPQPCEAAARAGSRRARLSAFHRRRSRQRPNAAAQLQFARFLGRGSVGTGVIRPLPSFSAADRLTRGPVMVPAGRFGPEPPGSAADEAAPAGTAPAPTGRGHRPASLRAECANHVSIYVTNVNRKVTARQQKNSPFATEVIP